MTKDDFKAWKARMGYKTHKLAADALGVSYNTERSFCDGSRDVPSYIEKLCGYIEAAKGGHARDTASDSDATVAILDADEAAPKLASAYLAAVRASRPAASMLLDANTLAGDFVKALKSLEAKGVVVCQN